VVNAPDGTVMRGKDEMRVYFSNLFAGFPDIGFEMLSFQASGDLQCDEWVMSGTQKGDYMGLPASGKKVSIRGVTVRAMKEGKTVQAAFYFDSATMMRQLGV
jgi:steroid delta-isomerase-like uncharacterized protein